MEEEDKQRIYEWTRQRFLEPSSAHNCLKSPSLGAGRDIGGEDDESEHAGYEDEEAEYDETDDEEDEHNFDEENVCDDNLSDGNLSDYMNQEEMEED